MYTFFPVFAMMRFHFMQMMHVMLLLFAVAFTFCRHESVIFFFTIQHIISYKNVHMEVCDKLYKRRVYLQWPRLKASTPQKMSHVCVFLVTSFFCSLNILR